MRTRWAGWLAVLLLWLTPAASICETRCELAGFGTGCHVADAAQVAHPEHHGAGQHSSMPAMAGMEPRGMAVTPHVGHTAFAAPASACTAHVCAEQPALPSVAISWLNQPVLGLVAASPDPARFTPHPATAVLFVRGPPHLRPATPVSLHTTLRV